MKVIKLKYKHESSQSSGLILIPMYSGKFAKSEIKSIIEGFEELFDGISGDTSGISERVT